MINKELLKSEVDAILASLYSWQFTPKQVNTNDLSLMSGHPGAIAMLVDIYNNDPSVVSKKTIQDCIQVTFSILENAQEFYPTYCGGLAGYGYFLLKLSNTHFFTDDSDQEIIDTIEEIIIQIDELLIEQLDINLHHDNVDILHGAVGMGIYFLERDNIICINKIVDKLEKDAKYRDGGLYWQKYEQYRLFTTVVDMGLAHGNASLLYFLAKVFTKDTKNEKVKKLISDSIRFHIDNAQQLNVEISSYFPHMIDALHFDSSSHTSENSRLAWCYGDLGVLHTLLIASITINEENLYDQIITMAENASKRKSKENTGVIDVGFCHGSSGIAAIFQSFYDLTKNIKFLEASQHWLSYTLSCKDQTLKADETAGYSFFVDNKKIADLSLLEGVGGVLFSYCKSLYQDMPLTDEILFLKVS
ncbi:MAG: hypothetical protein DI539_13840 [Flavobacterium psychrophilum]|nr:MAG: hypothetical protein DI539_13840 [Flavobacterium psychrophilum]